MREMSSQSINMNRRRSQFRGGETRIMKRALSSLLVFALVLTLLVPAFAFAADKTTEEKFNELKEKGLLNGVEDGSAALDRELTRAELAAILVRLFKLEPITGQSTFIDVPENHWAQKEGVIEAVAKAGLMGSTTTYSKTFSPDAKLTIAEVAKVAVSALGLTVDQNAKIDGVQSWAAPYVDAALKANLIPESKDYHANANRGILVDAAYVIYQTKLVPPVTELKVESVTATNLKEVVVKFNTAVDKSTVKAANFALAYGSSDVAASAYLADENTVVVEADNALINGGEYSLTVDKVKSTQGVDVVKETIKFTVRDVALPEVKEIKVTGPKSFLLVFSEPIASAGSVEVKTGLSLHGVNPNFAISGNEVEVELYTALTEGTTYTVTVKDFKDFAGYNNAFASLSLAYAKDTTSPTAEVASADPEKVVLKFNKPVSGLKASAFYHTFSAWAPQEILDADGNAIDSTKYYSSVTVVFYKKDDNGKWQGFQLPEGKVTFGFNATGVQDKWGNAYGGPATFEVTVSADRTAPTATIEVVDDLNLKVTFNKNVLFNEDNIAILDSDGKEVTGTTVTGGPKVFNVKFDKSLNGKTVVVNIKNVKDTTIGQNTLVSYTETVVIGDKTGPTVNSVLFRYVENGDKAIYVFYSEPVSETALTKGNYFFKGADEKLVTVSGTPTFYQNNKIVRIPLTASDKDKYIDGTGAFTAKLVVINVKDVAGNTLISFEPYPIDKIETAAPKVTDVVATDVYSVDVVFDQYLTRIDYKAFTVNGQEPAGYSISTDENGNTVVTLVPKVAFGYDATGSVTINITDSYKIQNIFGVNAANTVPATITDRIAPAVAKVNGKADVRWVAANTIEITYTEDIDPNRISALTYAVSGRTVDSVSVNQNVVTLNLKAVSGASYDSNSKPPKVTQKLDVYDTNGNKLSAGSEYTAINNL